MIFYYALGGCKRAPSHLSVKSPIEYSNAIYKSNILSLLIENAAHLQRRLTAPKYRLLQVTAGAGATP